MPDSDAHETIMSNRREAFVGAAGMNARKRGLSHEITAGASTSVYSSSTRSGSLGAGPSRSGASAPSSSGGIERSRGTGSRASRSRMYAKIESAMCRVRSS